MRDVLHRRDSDPTFSCRSILDDLTLFAIRLQEQAGLDVTSDGEWRRTHYVGEFLSRVGGFQKCRRYEH
jgi:methionine synthase II (cobalamin-independent)